LLCLGNCTKLSLGAYGGLSKYWRSVCTVRSGGGYIAPTKAEILRKWLCS
jgi:hypothetical protein